MLQYKVVETTTVTDDALERIINDRLAEGWRFDDVRFVVGEGSRRPAMAFVFFTRTEGASSAGEEAGAEPRRRSQSSQDSTSR